MDQTVNKDRPFVGQPHTHVGNRGKTPAENILYRDIFDAVIKSLVICVGDTKMRERADDDTLLIKDAYDIPEENIKNLDPVALAQTVCVELEKIQGIYPNVKKLQIVPKEKND